MLMLEHKRLDHRRVQLPTGMHPFAVRALGFPGHKQAIRKVQGTPDARWRCSTASARFRRCAWAQSACRPTDAIARFLDKAQPEPALFPADAQRSRRWKRPRPGATRSFRWPRGGSG